MNDVEPVMGPIPALGEHTDAILNELGFEADTIRQSRADGVVWGGSGRPGARSAATKRSTTLAGYFPLPVKRRRSSYQLSTIRTLRGVAASLSRRIISRRRAFGSTS